MTKISMRLSAGLIALAAVAAPASAQTQELISEPRGMVQNFDPVNLGPVLTELGIVWQERQLADGTRFIAASAGGAMTFNIVPTACVGPNGTSCLGAMTYTMFTGSPNQQSVYAFGQKHAFASTGMMSDGGGAYLARYDIADYGIPRGNVASSLVNYLSLAQRFQAEIAAKTVSADGFVDDMSASILTVRAAAAIGVDASVKGDGTTAALHQASMNASPELIRELFKSDNAPRNKISNLTQ